MESDKTEELDFTQEQVILITEKIFENNWSKMKQGIECTNKKEACKYSFIPGFLNYLGLMDIKSS